MAREEKNDNELLRKNAEKGNDYYIDRDIVNGPINNNVFKLINQKTTNLFVSISKDGNIISTRLSDRGMDVFEVKERNRKYSLLRDIDMSILYLNRSAKINFTRQMGGVSSKAYGSIFVYKNGFRINPYGEPNQDFFGIDSRKQQGFNRYLGTRDIMGKISIHGENDGFIETSSRSHGFVETASVESLQDFFVNRALKVLERYVTRVINWGEPLKDT